jgi:D-3-phosphoglycerate dehydrogenase
MAPARPGLVLVIDPTWELAPVVETFAGLDVRIERAERAEGDDVVGLLVSPDVVVGRPELERLQRLRAVATNSTGFEHLDVTALAEAGVWCSNVSGYCTGEVADHAIALVAALLRRLVDCDRAVRNGAWDVTEFPPVRIHGACLGIVGFGRIGQAVAARGAGLGMRVLAFDPLVPGSDVEAAGARPCGLDELLAEADAVTLHAAVESGSRGLLGARELGSMKAGAVLVNCTRAALVDHDALGEAVSSGRLAAVGLDVLPVEPPPPGEPALGWPRTVITPHSAWYAPETALLPYELAANDVARVLRGQEPVYALARPERPRV